VSYGDIQMKRTNLNFIIDIVAFVGFVLLTTTGVLLRYILPPGSGYYSTIWSLNRHEWGDIHFWVSMVFFLVLTFHLVLHWNWIVSVISGKPRVASGYRVGLGIVGLISVVSLAVSPLLVPTVRDTSNKGELSLSIRKLKDIPIYGSMTLKGVETTSGVPVLHIIKSLNLPEKLSEKERLGILKRRYGFEISDVKEIVNRYNNRK